MADLTSIWRSGGGCSAGDGRREKQRREAAVLLFNERERGSSAVKLRGEAVVHRWTVACDGRKEIEEKVEAKMEVSGRWFTCNYGGGDAGFLTKKVRGGQFW
ncbi:hypothetical protein HAX54_041596 [Datura stramonium]|uniref:Uncharacterized protein n=1 Tax=Datura stramonium TaxID=4076 RepID=A0ABS8VX84_DATST|nr:hypothetical protein [Datura stramonium]